MTQQAERIPAPVTTRSRMAYEEFLDWAEDGLWAEWVDGEVIKLMTASVPHQKLLEFLLTIVGLWVTAHDLGVVLPPPFQMKTGPHLPGREPDLLFVSKLRAGLLKNHFLDGPADLVVEIISPDSRVRDRITKFAEYEEGGVQEYWVLDPDQRSAEFYRLGEDGRYHPIHTEAGILHSSALEGCWIRPDWLWQDPLPNPLRVLEEWRLINR